MHRKLWNTGTEVKCCAAIPKWETNVKMDLKIKTFAGSQYYLPVIENHSGYNAPNAAVIPPMLYPENNNNKNQSKVNKNNNWLTRTLSLIAKLTPSLFVSVFPTVWAAVCSEVLALLLTLCFSLRYSSSFSCSFLWRAKTVSSLAICCLAFFSSFLRCAENNYWCKTCVFVCMSATHPIISTLQLPVACETCLPCLRAAACASALLWRLMASCFSDNIFSFLCLSLKIFSRFSCCSFCCASFRRASRSFSSNRHISPNRPCPAVWHGTTD